MIDCIKSEIKTFYYSRVLWIGLLVILVIPLYFQITTCQQLQDVAINQVETYEEVNASGDECDLSDLVITIQEMHKTFHPQTSINNSLAVMIGLGMLGFPALFSVFAGKEYRRYTIKPKIVYFSLLKVFVAKVLVAMACLLGFLMIYSCISYVVMKMCWEKYLMGIFDSSSIQFEVFHFTMFKNMELLFLVFTILMFFTFFCMLASFVFKSSVAGIIATIVFNYLTLPTKYSPHHIFYNFINRSFYQSSVSVFEFKENMDATLSSRVGIVVLSLYLLVGVVALLVLGKTQKN